MRYLGLASVVVLALCLSIFIPQAGANSPKQKALALQKQQEEVLSLRKQEARALQLQQVEALAPQLQKEEALADLKHQGALALQLQQELPVAAGGSPRTKEAGGLHAEQWELRWGKL